ncbi:hypothetical protein PRK78_003518 [Emydomyces testavorans]|uniref:DJ-1/PfpI domain-containing protein n=1 Tax=Emydomyces testavorans TaxID=2070801 RepID=A0AAF0DG68_9EURO|nr:hypothetical protein PRK78_003518 [Emydomyces testavorans]
MGSNGEVKPPINYAVIVYPGFQALDVFGPLDALSVIAKDNPINLAIIGPTLDSVSIRPLPRDGSDWNKGGNFSQSVVPTHTYDQPPKNVDVLIVPGGTGNRDPRVIEPTSKLARDMYPNVQYLFTVCTGSKIAAHAGLLDGRNATTNKHAFDEIASRYTNVNWIRKARWVIDGNIWTTSGISAGIDGMLAFLEHIYGKGKANEIAVILEYVRHEDPSSDPFCCRQPK